MDIENLVDEIVELCYHSVAISDDGYVQERATRAGIWDLIQQYTDELVEDRIATLTRELEAWREG